MATVTMIGGPYDGRQIERRTSGEDPDGPFLYCGYMGDGLVRVYRYESPGRYVYARTGLADELVT